MKTGSNFNILVVDDHALVREAFASMLRREFPDANVEVTGSCTEALGAARRNNYEVALVDIELGDRSGMELTMELRTLPNPPVVIAVSVHQESTFVSRSMQLGAKAYVAKDAPSSELFDAIRSTRDGRSYISKDLAEKYSQDTRAKNSTPLAHERLSNRELEVMLQIARGKTPKQVASDLCLSPKTVAVHKHNLCCKTGLRTTVDILKYAQTHGLV